MHTDFKSFELVDPHPRLVSLSDARLRLEAAESEELYFDIRRVHRAMVFERLRRLILDGQPTAARAHLARVDGTTHLSIERMEDDGGNELPVVDTFDVLKALMKLSDRNGPFRMDTATLELVPR